MPNDHYPSEYIDGHVEFFYLDFLVDKNVLIPRFETETLVRRVIHDLSENPVDMLIDVGTGSGIIPVSIGKNRKLPLVLALDISPEALQIAEKNAVNHGVQIDFRLSNLLSFCLNAPTELEHKNIVITANLPYIKAGDWEHMSPDTRHEPALALFWWSTTGFELYEEFFVQIDMLLGLSDIRHLTIYIEMGYDQADLARQACQSRGWQCEIFADPAGIERFGKIYVVTPTQNLF